MHTTIYEGVKDSARAERDDIESKLCVAFDVSATELERRLHQVGLFLMAGPEERPYAVGIRRLPPGLMQRRRQGP